MYLFRAADALAAGRVFEAGVYLREAVRRQLYAECAWKGCLPAKEAKQRSPMALLHALEAAGHVNYAGFQWTSEIIALCNKCAHCVPVEPRQLRCSIEVWHASIDSDPCGEPKDRPTKKCATPPASLFSGPNASDCDCDDDDPVDWWQEGGDE